MDLKRLDERLDELGQPAYRGRQVWEWASGGAPGYEAMTNLPLALRTALAADVPFSTLTAEAEQRSRDGTVKTLFRTHDGHPVEAVLMRYRDGRRSVCVSSQSGCPLTCTFCATGRMAFGRNLTASEILDQVLHFRRSEPVNHLVFMGMGEPFMNVDAVLDAARRLPDIGITHRRTTISTVGWLPGLERFVEEGHRADPPRAVAPRSRSDAAQRADAGERPVPPARRARPLPASLGADEPARVRRVRDARGRQRLARAGAGARRAPRPGGLQGQPHPLQPDGSVRRVVARGDRGVQG
jgi:adenine C2-methylase RlmN of 23S rRNA A2503 and tRNA A37